MMYILNRLYGLDNKRGPVKEGYPILPYHSPSHSCGCSAFLHKLQFPLYPLFSTKYSFTLFVSPIPLSYLAGPKMWLPFSLLSSHLLCSHLSPLLSSSAILSPQRVLTIFLQQQQMTVELLYYLLMGKHYVHAVNFLKTSFVFLRKHFSENLGFLLG